MPSLILTVGPKPGARLKGVKAMCQERKTRPSPRAFMRNLQGPQPLNQKILMLLRNNWKKMTTLQDCCGHPGEPGC
jgi:hypothetical protein